MLTATVRDPHRDSLIIKNSNPNNSNFNNSNNLDIAIIRNKDDLKQSLL